MSCIYGAEQTCDECRMCGRKYHAPTAEWKKTDIIPGIFAQDKNRKEGCEPRYLGENTAIGYRTGRCKCGNIVKSYQKYCDECGIKLEWGNVWAQRKENRMERLTQKDNAGYKLVMKSATECIGEDTDIKEWSISRSAKGTQTIRGYAVEKLAEYENLEEQRKLQKLPCAVGDTVYRINPVSEEPVIEMIVTKIEIRKDGELVIYTQNTVDRGELFYKCQESIDRTVFLTREKAETALRRMGESK